MKSTGNKKLRKKILGLSTTTLALLMITTIFSVGALATIFFSTNPVTHDIQILGADGQTYELSFVSYDTEIEAITLDENYQGVLIALEGHNLESAVDIQIEVNDLNGIVPTVTLGYATIHTISGQNTITMTNEAETSEMIFQNAIWYPMALTYLDVSTALNVDGVSPSASYTLSLDQLNRGIYSTPTEVSTADFTTTNGFLLMFDFDVSGISYGDYTASIILHVGL